MDPAIPDAVAPTRSSDVSVADALTCDTDSVIPNAKDQMYARSRAARVLGDTDLKGGF